MISEINILLITLKSHDLVGRRANIAYKPYNSLISRNDKVELIATEFFQQSCDYLGYLEQHTKSCRSFLVGKYIYFRLKNYHFYA